MGFFWSRSSFSNRPAGTRTSPIRSPAWRSPTLGVLRAEFDASALTLSRLNATRLIVRFADGALIDTELADILPPVRDVSDVMQDNVEVLARSAAAQRQRRQLDDGQESARAAAAGAPSR